VLQVAINAASGKRIVKVHAKDFKRKEDGYAWVNLGDVDVDWPAVRQAFADIGYAGSAVTELEHGDETYLGDVSRRFDRLVIGRPWKFPFVPILFFVGNNKSLPHHCFVKRSLGKFWTSF
jgi:hypothetical protein